VTDVADLLDFTCPRCAVDVAEAFYGPCDACRTQLRETMQVAARDIEVEAFAPKMNVVPNQVATKD
jgi:hypothetical protein